MRNQAPWEHYDVEQTVDDRDGAPMTLRIQGRPLNRPDGSLSGAVGIVTDITEQRRTEEALRAVIDRYRLLVEVNPDPIVVHQDGLVRYMSPACRRFAGVEGDPSEIVGRQILDFLHPSSLEDTVERISKLTEPGMVSEPAEALLLRTDGTPVAMESISVRIDWEGRPAYQVILRDVSERRRAEAAMRYQASLVTQVSDAIVATDTAGSIRSWNRAAEALYGLAAEDVIGRPVADVLGSAAVAGDGTIRDGEVEHRGADGSSFPVHVSVAPVRDDLGEPSGDVAICTDLTERLKRRAAEARFSAAVGALDEGVAVVERDGSIVSVNPSARTMLGEWLREGMDSLEILRQAQLVAEDGSPLGAEDHPLVVGLRTGQPQSRVVVGMHEDDAVRWFSVSVQPLVHEPAERIGAVVCSFSEITERKRIEEQLSFQATHDALTRLPNRDLVLDAVDEAVARARFDGSSVGVLLIDLDRFKTINDTFGHAVGDQVLESVAARIAESARSGDCVGRLAGDEFVIVCPGLSSPDAARELANRVAAAVRAPVRLPSGRELVVTASIGVAFVDAGEGTPEVALSHADVAMYRAKELGRARTELFDEELRSVVSRRLLIHEGLRRAVDGREITAHYQVIVCATTGAVVGVEALARWEHRTLGHISPSEFVPIAEDTGLMVALGTEILRTACGDVASWTAEGRCRPDLTLNVNLSPRQLADPTLVPAVAEMLEVSGFDPSKLWLEVTESVLMEDATFVARTLKQLRRLGVHFAIDDFGTGYSSLAYLKRFPVEALKIDRSFVEGLGVDSESDAIVEAIVRLAQTLNLRTIAEGVETPAQLARVRALGCELLQGYLFSVPVAASQLQFDPTPLLATG